MKSFKKKLEVQRDPSGEEFQLLLNKVTKSVRKRAIKHNQPIAVSKKGVVYLIFPDGREVRQNY